MIGDLLGDGHLRFTVKDTEGKAKCGTNARYAMTLKSKDYIDYLKENIYSEICTSTPVRPWPNPKTGKLPTQSQYAFNTKSFLSLTLLHNEWYKWSEEKSKYIKIVPLNILELLTPIGLLQHTSLNREWRLQK